MTNIVIPDEEAVFLRVTMLGACNVGKSAIASRWCDKPFAFDEYEETIEERFRDVPHAVENTKISLTVLDTCTVNFVYSIYYLAGKDEYQASINTWIEEGHGYVLVFDLSSRETFEVLQDMIVPTLQQHLQNGAEKHKVHIFSFAFFLFKRASYYWATNWMKLKTMNHCAKWAAMMHWILRVQYLVVYPTWKWVPKPMTM